MQVKASPTAIRNAISIGSIKAKCTNKVQNGVRFRQFLGREHTLLPFSDMPFRQYVRNHSGQCLHRQADPALFGNEDVELKAS